MLPYRTAKLNKLFTGHHTSERSLHVNLLPCKLAAVAYQRQIDLLGALCQPPKPVVNCRALGLKLLACLILRAEPNFPKELVEFQFDSTDLNTLDRVNVQ